MGKQKKIRKAAITRQKTVKANDSRVLNSTKTSVKVKQEQQAALKKKLAAKKGLKVKAEGKSTTTIDGVKIHRVEKANASLFYSYNKALGPPYKVLVDTNFFHFSMENKIDLHQGLVDCLLAKATPVVTDCVLAELEKLGSKYRLALKIAKDPRNERHHCDHEHGKGYADDCFVRILEASPIYLLCTQDKQLKQRVRKIPGVPIVYVTDHKYAVERLGDQL
jgi:U3 small nucleolar RNA-associated protein 24